MNGLNAFTNYTDENGKHRPLKDLGGGAPVGNVVTSVNGMTGDVTLATNVNYSTEEQDTGLKWIDGRSIYSKTFSIENGTYTGNYTIELTRTIGMGNIIDAYGFIHCYYNDVLTYVSKVGNSVNTYVSSNIFQFFTAGSPILRLAGSAGGYVLKKIYVTVLYVK